MFKSSKVIVCNVTTKLLSHALSNSENYANIKIKKIKLKYQQLTAKFANIFKKQKLLNRVVNMQIAYLITHLSKS